MCRSIRFYGILGHLCVHLCSGDGLFTVVRTQLVCFDTVVLDLTEELSDPVDVLFGIQLGGGTDINQAVSYCAGKIAQPRKSHLILVTDLYEGGNAEELVARFREVGE